MSELIPVEFNILERKVPVLNVNIPQVREYLDQLLSQYKGIVVTEETLEGCKDIQKRLSKLSKDIDEKRKEIKKDFTKPITDFEAECKTLLALIDDVNDPIKDGIKVFDDKRRDAKKEQILDLIEEFGKPLDDKYFEMLVVDEKWLNVTTTIKSIKAEIAEKVEKLKKMQDSEGQTLALIAQQIQMANDMLELGTPLTEKDFAHLLNGEIDLMKITSAITEAGKARKQAEVTAAEKAVAAAKASEPKAEEPDPTPEPTPAPEPEVKVDEPKHWLSIDIMGTKAEHDLVLEFLDEHGIKFEVVD